MPIMPVPQKGTLMPPFWEIECPTCGRAAHDHTQIEAFICLAVMRSHAFWAQFRDVQEFTQSVREDIEAL